MFLHYTPTLAAGNNPQEKNVISSLWVKFAKNLQFQPDRTQRVGLSKLSRIYREVKWKLSRGLVTNERREGDEGKKEPTAGEARPGEQQAGRQEEQRGIQ